MTATGHHHDFTDADRIPDAPVYHASPEEMLDLSALLAKVSELAHQHGAVRIDPPPEWVHPPLRMQPSSRFFVRNQNIPEAPFVDLQTMRSGDHPPPTRKRARMTRKISPSDDDEYEYAPPTTTPNSTPAGPATADNKSNAANNSSNQQPIIVPTPVPSQQPPAQSNQHSVDHKTALRLQITIPPPPPGTVPALPVAINYANVSHSRPTVPVVPVRTTPTNDHHATAVPVKAQPQPSTMPSNGVTQTLGAAEFLQAQAAPTHVLPSNVTTAMPASQHDATQQTDTAQGVQSSSGYHHHQPNHAACSQPVLTTNNAIVNHVEGAQTNTTVQMDMHVSQQNSSGTPTGTANSSSTVLNGAITAASQSVSVPLTVAPTATTSLTTQIPNPTAVTSGSQDPSAKEDCIAPLLNEVLESVFANVANKHFNAAGTQQQQSAPTVMRSEQITSLSAKTQMPTNVSPNDGDQYRVLIAHHAHNMIGSNPQAPAPTIDGDLSCGKGISNPCLSVNVQTQTNATAATVSKAPVPGPSRAGGVSANTISVASTPKTISMAYPPSPKPLNPQHNPLRSVLPPAYYAEKSSPKTPPPQDVETSPQKQQVQRTCSFSRYPGVMKSKVPVKHYSPEKRRSESMLGNVVSEESTTKHTEALPSNGTQNMDSKASPPAISNEAQHAYLRTQASIHASTISAAMSSTHHHNQISAAFTSVSNGHVQEMQRALPTVVQPDQNVMQSQIIHQNHNQITTTMQVPPRKSSFARMGGNKSSKRRESTPGQHQLPSPLKPQHAKQTQAQQTPSQQERQSCKVEGLKLTINTNLIGMSHANAVPNSHSSYSAAPSVESSHAHATAGITPTVTAHHVADHHHVQRKSDIAAIIHQPCQQYRHQQQSDQSNQANHASSTPVRDKSDYENSVDLTELASASVAREVAQQQQQLQQLQTNLLQSHPQLTVNTSGIDGNVVGNVEHSKVPSISNIIAPVVGPSIPVPNSQVPQQVAHVVFRQPVVPTQQQPQSQVQAQQVYSQPQLQQMSQEHLSQPQQVLQEPPQQAKQEQQLQPQAQPQPQLQPGQLSQSQQLSQPEPEQLLQSQQLQSQTQTIHVQTQQQPLKRHQQPAHPVAGHDSPQQVSHHPHVNKLSTHCQNTVASVTVANPVQAVDTSVIHHQPTNNIPSATFHPQSEVPKPLASTIAANSHAVSNSHMIMSVPWVSTTVHPAQSSPVVSHVKTPVVQSVSPPIDQTQSMVQTTDAPTNVGSNQTLLQFCPPTVQNVNQKANADVNPTPSTGQAHQLIQTHALHNASVQSVQHIQAQAHSHEVSALAKADLVKQEPNLNVFTQPQIVPIHQGAAIPATNNNPTMLRVQNSDTCSQPNAVVNATERSEICTISPSDGQKYKADIEIIGTSKTAPVVHTVEDDDEVKEVRVIRAKPPKPNTRAQSGLSKASQATAVGNLKTSDFTAIANEESKTERDVTVTALPVRNQPPSAQVINDVEEDVPLENVPEKRLHKRKGKPAQVDYAQDSKGRLTYPILFPDSPTPISLNAYKRQSKKNFKQILGGIPNMIRESDGIVHSKQSNEERKERIDRLENAFWSIMSKGLNGQPYTVAYGVDVEAEGAFDAEGNSYVEWYGMGPDGRIVKDEKLMQSKLPSANHGSAEQTNGQRMEDDGDDDKTHVDHDDGYIEENERITPPTGSAPRLFMSSNDKLEEGDELIDEGCALDPVPRMPPIKNKGRMGQSVKPAYSTTNSRFPPLPRRVGNKRPEPRCHVGNLNQQGLLRHLPVMPGINHTMFYIGQLFTRFCWHVEDAYLNSVSYLHHGSSEKVWYAVPPDHAPQFEQYASEHVFAPQLGDSPNRGQVLFMNKTTTFDPRTLKRRGIKVYRVIQKEGSFVLTAPRGYHAGFNCGYNVAEAVNFAHPCWLSVGREAAGVARRIKRPLSVPWEYLLFHEGKSLQTLSNVFRTHTSHSKQFEMALTNTKYRRMNRSYIEMHARVVARELAEVINFGEGIIRKHARTKRVAMLDAVDSMVKNNQLGPEFGHGAGIICSECSQACHFYAEICGNCEDSLNARCVYHFTTSKKLCKIGGHRSVIVRRHDPVFLLDLLETLEQIGKIETTVEERYKRMKQFVRPWETPLEKSSGLRMKLNLSLAVSRLPPNVTELPPHPSEAGSAREQSGSQGGRQQRPKKKTRGSTHQATSSNIAKDSRRRGIHSLKRKSTESEPEISTSPIRSGPARKKPRRKKAEQNSVVILKDF